jgi:hypothetical protein
MKRSLATAAVLVVALSGCASSSHEAASAPTVTKRDDIRGIAHGIFDPASDAKMVHMGDSFCALSRASNTSHQYTSEVLATLSNAQGETAELTGAYVLVSGYSLTDLCPDQQKRWN